MRGASTEAGSSWSAPTGSPGLGHQFADVAFQVESQRRVSGGQTCVGRGVFGIRARRLLQKSDAGGPGFGAMTAFLTPYFGNRNTLNGMNDAGQIVGSACCYYPFLYNGPSGQLIGGDHGGNATAINNNGHVVGYLVDSTGNLE
jgi:hypothetical protein